MDRGYQVSRSVAWAEAAESLVEREDDELQAVAAMLQPRLGQAISKRSAAARHIRASYSGARLSSVSDPHWAVRRNERRARSRPSLSR
jgi:hypothetical protein